MKKQLFWLIAAILLTSPVMLGLASCTDEIDNPVSGGDEPEQSTIDTKEWTIDDNFMDTTVKPGDDFYMYCNGNYWKQTETATISGFLYNDVGDALSTLANTLRYPNLETLVNHAKDLDSTEAAATEALTNGMQMLANAKTVEEAWKTTGKLIKDGYTLPFIMLPLSVNGHMALAIGYANNSDFPMDKEENIEQSLMKMLKENKAEFMKHIKPLRSNKTRGISDELPMVTAICEGMGLNTEYVYTLDTYIEIIARTNQYSEGAINELKGLQQLSLEEYIGKMEAVMMTDTAILSNEYMKEYNSKLPEAKRITIKSVASKIRDKYMKYEDSYQFAKANLTPEMKQRGLETAKEIVNAFGERVKENNWMSNESKKNVLEKLDYMTLNVAYPDEWLEEGLTDLSESKSMMEDIQKLRGALVALKIKIASLDTQKGGFQSIIANEMALTGLNAFYYANTNSINIFPVWLMKPAYDENQSDAINYSYYGVVAHEVTHGFDTKGSNYDKKGDPGRLWATDADEQEYNRLTKALADYYSTIEVLPNEMPGLYNQGEYTLAENIADLGGVEVAFHAYTKKLKEEGYKGEEFAKQQKKFFRGWANIWRAKYTAEYAQWRTTGEGRPDLKDNHSLSRERVNGVIANIDAWYDAYDVTPDQKLYRSPEERVHIW